jgi:hypothetical protein
VSTQIICQPLNRCGTLQDIKFNMNFILSLILISTAMSHSGTGGDEIEPLSRSIHCANMPTNSEEGRTLITHRSEITRMILCQNPKSSNQMVVVIAARAHEFRASMRDQLNLSSCCDVSSLVTWQWINDRRGDQ